jgi:hypothetical protein
MLSLKKAGKKHSIKIANRSFVGVTKFKYLGTTVTDQNVMLEEIKSRLKSGNACYHSVQSLLSSRLLSRDVKVNIYKTKIPPVVLYGCETWSLTLREEHRLRVFENNVLPPCQTTCVDQNDSKQCTRNSQNRRRTLRLQCCKCIRTA